MTMILVPVSIGELIDKITILEIKAGKFTDATKLENVQRELAELSQVWQQAGLDRALIQSEWDQLRAINTGLWGIEDRKRLKEASASFDAEFIALARAVYFENDKRAAVKKRINMALGSAIVEEKSYSDYQGSGQVAPRI
jgi:Family of unknown function (DUF6165)